MEEWNNGMLEYFSINHHAKYYADCFTSFAMTRIHLSGKDNIDCFAGEKEGGG